jgi:DNA-binding transcriptional LysR family regulator
MSRDNLSDVLAFLAVARAGSFTQAAKDMGISQPALSHTVRGLEARLGLRLLNRTTRSVSTTEAGERLLRTVAPHFDGIAAGLAELTGGPPERRVAVVPPTTRGRSSRVRVPAASSSPLSLAPGHRRAASGRGRTP